jgi:hypothetical protein
MLNQRFQRTEDMSISANNVQIYFFNNQKLTNDLLMFFYHIMLKNLFKGLSEDKTVCYIYIT